MRIALSLLIFLIGCALPPSEHESMVGRLDGVPFVKRDELEVAGLVDEALGFVKRNRFREAEIRLLRADYIRPQVDAVQFNLAAVLEKQGRYEEALEILKGLLERDQSSIQYRIAIGMALVGVRDYPAAIEQLKTSFRLANVQGDLIAATNISRTISVTAFNFGDQQTALCYSYEAAALSTKSEEFERHLRTLLMTANYQALIEQANAAIKGIKDWVKRPAIHYYLALARAGINDLKGAYESIKDAEDLKDQADGIQGELSAAYLVIRAQIPDLQEQSKTEALEEQLEAMRLAASEIYDTNQSLALYWPPNLYQQLARFAEEVKSELEG